MFDFGLAKEPKEKDVAEAPDGFNAAGLTGLRQRVAPKKVTLCANCGLSAGAHSSVLVWAVFLDRTPSPNASLDKKRL